MNTPTERAFSRRQWSRRWAVWRRALAVLVVVGLVGAAGWLVFLSDVLAVETVEVEGEGAITADRITEVAEVPVGKPLARTDLDQIAARVERIREVHHAEVGRSWPHTVVVTVTERTPVAVVERDGVRRLVDAEGVQFRVVKGRRKGLPTIVAGGERAAEEAAKVVAVLPADVARRVTRLDATTMDSITLRLTGGREVVWGSAEESERKAEVLAVLVERKGKVLDVSVPSAPTVSLG
ncbi:MAG: cell division protein FtsQ/DivIB [Nocardioidaceae bacterium]